MPVKKKVKITQEGEDMPTTVRENIPTLTQVCKFYLALLFFLLLGLGSQRSHLPCSRVQCSSTFRGNICTCSCPLDIFF